MAAWTYPHLRGPLYPTACPPSEMLARYVRTFNFVELDALYHAFPRRRLLENWAKQAGPGFRFSPKINQTISHKQKLVEIDDLLQQYLAGLEPLRRAQALGPLVLNLPPSFRHSPSNEEALSRFIAAVRPDHDLAIEFRHASWWTPEIRRTLEETGACATWTVLDGVTNPLWRTADFLYVRFVGDYDLERADWGTILRDRLADFASFAGPVKEAAASVRDVHVCMTNHLEGSASDSLVRLAHAWDVAVPDLSAAKRSVGQPDLGAFA